MLLNFCCKIYIKKKKNGKNKIEDEKIFPSTGIEPGSPTWKTSKIIIKPLQTVESYWKYHIHYRLAMYTNSDYMEARHCRNALVYKG